MLIDSSSAAPAVGPARVQWRARRRHGLDRIAAEATVSALMTALAQRDCGTAQHSERVAALAALVGERVGVANGYHDDLVLAARLHDVGKLGIPDRVLQKGGPLSDLEWRVMRSHSVRGAEIVSRIPRLDAVARAVRHVHERWDGSGYPDGLCGDEIPVESRIIAACDAYDAMRSRRPYCGPLDGGIARRELQAVAGSQLDPVAVDALLAELNPRY